jgi:Tol biopolymer transport system component
VAFDRRDERTADDVWSLDLSRQTMSRLTFGGTGRGPIWSADGSKIAYTSAEGGVVGLYEKSASGTDAARRLYASQANNMGALVAEQFSPDGKFVLFFGTLGAATTNDIYVLPLTPDSKPTAVVQTPFTDAEAQFSPDGRWLAYYTMETGRREIYVQPFPSTGAKWQISNTGGRQPMWRPDGKDFYVTEDRKLYAVDVRAGSRLEYGTPHYLFDLKTNVTSATRSYASSRDGQRFRVNMLLETTESPINVVVNWTAELKK